MHRRFFVSALCIAFLAVTGISLAAATELPLTDTQLKKLIALINERGGKTTIDLEPASALGIDTTLHLPPLPNIGVEDDEGFGHQFSILPEDQGYLLGRLKLSNQNLGTISAYRINSELTLISAITFRKGGYGVLTMPTEDAKLGLLQELSFWSSYTDKQ